MKNISVLFAIICVALGLAACGGGSGDVTTVSLTVTQTGSTSYSIDAANLNDIAGFDLTLNYDAASLAAPTIVPGSLVAGCVMIANTAAPGSIKIAIISATKSISGNGQIATISFASQTGSGGMVSGTASLVDSAGKPVSAVMKIPATGSVTPPAPPLLPPPVTPIPVPPVTPASAP